MSEQPPGRPGEDPDEATRPVGPPARPDAAGGPTGGPAQQPHQPGPPGWPQQPQQPPGWPQQSGPPSWPQQSGPPGWSQQPGPALGASGPHAGGGLVPPSQPDTPLHPLLPGQGGASSGVPSAHLQQHAASAGPSEGARGALWFVVVLALIVVGAIVALGLLLVSSGGEIIDDIVSGAGDDPQGATVDDPPVGPDQLLLDSIGELVGSTSSQAFVFRLEQRRIVRIDVIGQGGLDPVVSLFDEGGQQIGRDDDGGDGLNSLLELELQPGTYRIEVESFGSSTGEFRVTAFTR